MIKFSFSNQALKLDSLLGHPVYQLLSIHFSIQYLRNVAVYTVDFSFQSAKKTLICEDLLYPEIVNPTTHLAL